MLNDSKSREPRSWPSTLGATLALGAVAVLAFLYVPQWILVELRLGDRALLAWLATGLISLAFGAFCYAAWRSTS